jgi:type VI protein secretion system component VasK
MVRDRLTDLREELGIRFPVYVVVTKPTCCADSTSTSSP